jgi:hypothetical protein
MRPSSWLGRSGIYILWIVKESCQEEKSSRTRRLGKGQPIVSLQLAKLLAYSPSSETSAMRLSPAADAAFWALANSRHLLWI